MTSPPYSDLPEVWPTNYPQVTPAENPFNIEDTLPEAVYAHRDDGVQGGQFNKEYTAAAAGGGASGDRRICGIKRKLFLWLAAIITIIIVGVGVGAAVGITFAKASPDTTSSSEPSAPDTSGGNSSTSDSSSAILSNSGIASCNYTDSKGYQHYHVFHQDRNNSIIGSFWDSQNKTWEARSLSASLESSSINLDVIEGTPLSATCYSYGDYVYNIRVYMLLSGNSIGELYKPDVSIDTQWRQGDLGSQKVIKTGEGSNIAAWRPTGGTDSWPPILLLWQDDQQLQFANGNNWKKVHTLTPATNGTGIAVTNILDADNDVSWRFYYDNSDVLQEYKLDRDLNEWDATHTLGNLPSKSTTNYAAVGFDKNCLIAINLEDNGNLNARSWNSSSWSDSNAPILKNSPKGISAASNFTGISIHADKRVYGITNGAIHEWEFTASDPMEWHYVGEVRTTV